MQHTGPPGTLHLPPAGSTSSMHTSSSSSSMAAGPFTHHGWSHSPMTAANTAATAAAAAAAAGSAAYMVPQSMQQQTMSMNYSGMNLPMTTAAMPVTPPYGSSGSGGSSGVSRHVTNMPVGVLADTDSRKPRGRSGPKSKFSPFIGVSQYKRTGRWEAHIWDSSSSTRGSRVSGGKAGKGKQLHLGSFLTAAQAARAYDRAALLLRGPNAALNFPLEEYSNDPVLEELSHMSRTELVLALRKTCDMELEAAALEAFHAKVPAAAAHLLHNITGPAPSGTNTMTPPPAAAAAGDLHFGGTELLPQMQPWQQQQQQQLWLQQTHAEPLDPISESPLPAAAAAAAAMQGDLPMHQQPWTGSTPTAALLQMPGNAVGTPFASTAAAAAVHQAEQQQQQQQHSVPDLVPMRSAPAGHSAPLLPQQQQQQQQHGVSAASPLHPHLSAPSPLSYGCLAAADSPSPVQQQQQQQQAMYYGMSGLPTAESAPVPLSFEYSLDHHHHDAIFQQQQQQQLQQQQQVHSQELSLQTNASAPLLPTSYMQQQQQQTSAPDTAYYQQQEHNGPARQQQQGDDVLLPVLPPAWSSPLPWSNYPQDHHQQQHPMTSHDVNLINNNHHKLQGPRPHQDNQPGTSPDKIQAYQACQAHQAGLGPDKIQADQAHQARSQMISPAVVFGYESPTAADTAMADRINQPAAAAALKGNAQQYGTANPVPIPAAAAADNAPAGRHQMPRSSPWQVTLEDESSTSSSGPSRGSSSGSDQQHLHPLHRQQQQQQRMHSTAMHHYGQMHQQQQPQQQRPGSARCSVAGSSSSSLVGRSGAKGTVVLPVANNNSGSPCIAPAAAAAHGHGHGAAENARDLHHASSTKVSAAAAAVAAVAPEQESIGRRSTAGSNSTGILFSPTILPGGKQLQLQQQQQQQWGLAPDEQNYYHHHHQQQQQHGRWHPGQVHPATAAAAAVPVSTAATAAAGWPQQQQHVLSPYVYSTENAVPGLHNTVTTAAAAAVGGSSKGGNLTPRHMTSHGHVISPLRDVSDDWANLLNPSPSIPKDHQQQSSDLVVCDRDHHHHQQQQQQQLDSDVILYTKPHRQASTRPSSTSPAAAAAADVPLTFRPSATPPQSPHNTAATAAAAAATLGAVTHSQQQQQGQSADNTPAAAAAAGLERTISNITLSNIPPSRTVSSLVMAELARVTSGCPGSGDHHDAAAAAAAAASDLIMMECQHLIYHQHSLPGLEQLDNLLMTNQQISNPVMTNQITNQQIRHPPADHQISDHTDHQQQQQRVREYNSILDDRVKNDKHELPHLVPVAVSGPPAAATAAAAAAAVEADMSVSGLGQNASGGKRGITDGNNVMDEEVDMPAAKRPRSPVTAAAVRSVTNQMHRQDGSIDGNASAATAAGHSQLPSPERLGWWEMMQY